MGKFAAGADIWTCHQNISRFHEQLREASDEARRKTLLKLLRDEEEKLKKLEHPAR